MKYVSKLFILIITIQLIFINIIPNYVDASYFTFRDIFDNGDQFIEDGGDGEIDEQSLRDTSNTVFSIVFYIGIALSVGVGGVMGIQLMLASAEEKAKLKERLVPYIIGCIVIFASFTIWRIVVLVLNNI